MWQRRREQQRVGKRCGAMNQPVQKNTLYVGGLAEEVDEKIQHAALVLFSEGKDIKTLLDQSTQKYHPFGFVTFLSATTSPPPSTTWTELMKITFKIVNTHQGNATTVSFYACTEFLEFGLPPSEMVNALPEGELTI
ncbi:unnamed protein product [Urochloa humidicola]